MFAGVPTGPPPLFPAAATKLIPVARAPLTSSTNASRSAGVNAISEDAGSATTLTP
jgi:hypothetical protein